jgi:hypothetical protein
MSDQSFSKALTANDTGASGGHQAGTHIPKSQTDLLSFLPELDRSIKNPSVWLVCRDEAGVTWRFRYIYYNNKLHDEGGTRDEYRITHMTGFMRSAGAQPGDILVISGKPRAGILNLRVLSSSGDGSEPEPKRIKLRGWQRVF